MKTSLSFLLAVSVLLSACGSPAPTPTEESGEGVCQTGTEFLPGAVITLGDTDDYTAILRTYGGVDPNGVLEVVLTSLTFAPAAFLLPEDGQSLETGWQRRVRLTVGNCGGRYFYAATVNEVVMPTPDPVCAKESSGPMKPWPFFDDELVYAEQSEEVWLLTGSAEPVIVRTVNGEYVWSLIISRPYDGEETLTLVPVLAGELLVTVSNCGEALYYKAKLVKLPDIDLSG